MSDRIYQVNLEELIEDYTWHCYKKKKGLLKSLFLRRSNYVFDIRWGYIDFKHVTNPDKKEIEAGNQSTAAQGTSARVPADQKQAVIEEAVGNLTPQVDMANRKDVELYFSEYENKTSKPQKYTFTATRETTATTRIEMQENYTIGAKTNFEVNLAEIVKFGGEISGQFSVTETKAEEFTKTLSWNINTEILVPRYNKAKASLYVYELPSKSSFVVKTTIRLPSGLLPVSIRKVNDGKEVHTEWISDLGILFDQDYLNRSSVEVVPQKVIMDDGDEIMENQIVLTTRGVCRNVTFKNQNVKVECHRIPGSPKEKDMHEEDGGES